MTPEEIRQGIINFLQTPQKLGDCIDYKVFPTTYHRLSYGQFNGVWRDMVENKELCFTREPKGFQPIMVSVVVK